MQILVTGANGHLGFNLSKALLEAGYRVRGSVRSLADTGKTTRLKALGDIALVEAALHRPEQLRAAMAGVDVLFHTAAVYAYAAPGQTSEILDASINGAATVLRAAAAVGVRKVILTSSIVSLPLTVPGAAPVCEQHWADNLRVPYVHAKTEGEKVAWRLAKELGINLVTLLPGAIIGPGFARNTPSIDMIEAMMLGAMRIGVLDSNYPLVDVRDVVTAHILAAERDCAGRFVVCNDSLPSFRTILQTLHALDRKIPPPLMTIPNCLVGAMPFFDRLNRRILGSPLIASPEMLATVKGKVWNASNQRIKTVLGWQQQISLAQSLRDTLEAIKMRGINPAR